MSFSGSSTCRPDSLPIGAATPCARDNFRGCFMDLSHLLAGGAILGVVTACWARIKQVCWRGVNLLIQQIEIQEQMTQMRLGQSTVPATTNGLPPTTRPTAPSTSTPATASTAWCRSSCSAAAVSSSGTAGCRSSTRPAAGRSRTPPPALRHQQPGQGLLHLDVRARPARRRATDQVGLRHAQRRQLGRGPGAQESAAALLHQARTGRRQIRTHQQQPGRNRRPGLVSPAALSAAEALAQRIGPAHLVA